MSGLGGIVKAFINITFVLAFHVVTALLVGEVSDVFMRLNFFRV